MVPCPRIVVFAECSRFGELWMRGELVVGTQNSRHVHRLATALWRRWRRAIAACGCAGAQGRDLSRLRDLVGLGAVVLGALEGEEVARLLLLSWQGRHDEIGCHGR